jgi:hypothetical protein
MGPRIGSAVSQGFDHEEGGREEDEIYNQK